MGIAHSHGPTWPASDAPADREAAEFHDVLLRRVFADPLPTGRYPQGVAELMPGRPGAVAADLEIIAEPLKGYGVDCYAPARAGAPEGTETSFGGVRLPAELPFSVRGIEGRPRTDFGRPVVPEGLTELLTGLRDRYGDRLPPVMITENGRSCEGPDGQDRIAYLAGHVRAPQAALEEGVDVRGHFVWPPPDTFEWAEGYARRFGLVHVDLTTLERAPKASYAWYREPVRCGARPERPVVG